MEDSEEDEGDWRGLSFGDTVAEESAVEAVTVLLYAALVCGIEVEAIVASLKERALFYRK